MVDDDKSGGPARILSLRPGQSPREILADFLAYLDEAGESVDQVMIVGLSERNEEHPAGAGESFHLSYTAGMDSTRLVGSLEWLKHRLLTDRDGAAEFGQ